MFTLYRMFRLTAKIRNVKLSSCYFLLMTEPLKISQEWKIFNYTVDNKPWEEKVFE